MRYYNEDLKQESNHFKNFGILHQSMTYNVLKLNTEIMENLSPEEK